MRFNFKLFLVSLVLLFLNTTIFSQDDKELEGRWDLVISKDGEQLPSWLEVKKSGYKTLVGRFVYAFGSARPISYIELKDGITDQKEIEKAINFSLDQPYILCQSVVGTQQKRDKTILEVEPIGSPGKGIGDETPV